MTTSGSQATTAAAANSDKIISVPIPQAPLRNERLSCRMYESKYPEVDEVVLVTVRQISEMAAYVNLLEYNGIEGMVLLSELSRRRIRSVQKLVRVGKNEVVVVLRVDKEKGYIDLSKKKITPEDIQKCEERYNKSKTVHSIMRHVAEKRDAVLEDLYVSIGWPLYKKYGHAYDAFKQALTEPDVVFAGLDMSDETRAELMANIVRRLTPQKLKIRADIEVACFAFEGINAVKSALSAGKLNSTEELPITIKLIAPPLYVITTNCLDKVEGVAALNESIEKIKSAILASKGNIIVKRAPKAVSESDELELAEMLKKSEKENAEVSGDEDSEGEN